MTASSTPLEQTEAMPGVAVAIVVAATLGVMTAHCVLTLEPGASSMADVTMTVVSAALLLAWMPFVLRPSGRTIPAIVVAACGALTAFAGAQLHAGETAGGYYWIGVLLLGLGALIQTLVRPPAPRRRRVTSDSRLAPRSLRLRRLVRLD